LAVALKPRLDTRLAGSYRAAAGVTNMNDIIPSWTRTGALLCAAALLNGCNTIPGGGKPGETVVKARQEIERSRQSVVPLVIRVKTQFAGIENSADYVNARRLYDTAMSENNTWVTSLKLAIANAEQIGESAAFREQGERAAKATQAFVDYARQLTEHGAPKAASAALIAEAVRILVENGIAIWKAYREQAKEERIAAAEQAELALRWPGWEQIK
jgi:hypothetical protein